MGHSAIFQIEVNKSTVENNNIDIRANSGIRFYGGTTFTIRDNYIFSSKGYGNYGVQISQAYSNGIPMKNVFIENNIIRYTPYAGIALYSSRGNDLAEATIRNNIISQCGFSAPNMDDFPYTFIEEGGGINIQSFQKVTISNNTLFNNHGSAIWLDNRFYPSDVNFDELAKMDKSAIIINNIIVGSHSTQKSVYGIEKYISDDRGTTITTHNNIFYDNQNGSNSNNITLNSDNFIDENPYFIDASISNNFEVLNKKLDFRLKSDSKALDKNGKVIVGASKKILNRNLFVK
jgi:parallel beta-helix repeat protein